MSACLELAGQNKEPDQRPELPLGSEKLVVELAMFYSVPEWQAGEALALWLKIPR